MNNQLQNQYLKYLGCKARDAETGYEGVVDSVCFDMHGNVQASISLSGEKELPNARWLIDIERIVVI
jgi:hypothetical protein